MREGAGGVWEISILSSQFCYEPKNALRIKSLKKSVEFTPERLMSSRELELIAVGRRVKGACKLKDLRQRHEKGEASVN